MQRVLSCLGLTRFIVSVRFRFIFICQFCFWRSCICDYSLCYSHCTHFNWISWVFFIVRRMNARYAGVHKQLLKHTLKPSLLEITFIINVTKLVGRHANRKNLDVSSLALNHLSCLLHTQNKKGNCVSSSLMPLSEHVWLKQ